MNQQVNRSLSAQTPPIHSHSHSHHSSTQALASHSKFSRLQQGQHSESQSPQQQQQQQQQQQSQPQKTEVNRNETALYSPLYYSPQQTSPQVQSHGRTKVDYSSPNRLPSHSLYNRQNAVFQPYLTPGIVTPGLGFSETIQQPSQAFIAPSGYGPPIQLYHSSSLSDSVASPLSSSTTGSSNISVSEAFFPDIFNQSIAQPQSPSSPGEGDQNGHHRNPFLDKSLCVVCGDRARGCNFGAITCASCKEFFRRNAFKLDKLRCYFQNKCEINMHSRRFCAACRLIKCNQSGMKSEYIMSEKEKQERQMKIHERKKAKKPFLEGSTALTPEATFNAYETMYIQTSQIENPLLYSNSIPNTSPTLPAQVFSDETESQIKAMIKNIKIIRESHYYQSMFQLHLHTSQSDKALQMHEECKIRYLTTIVQIMQAETITQMSADQENKCIDLFTLTNIVMFNFIKLCKKLSGYNNLTIEDQITLIRGRGMESLILWTTMIIDLEKERWEILDIERNIKFSLKLEHLREANPTLYDEHRQYVSSFEEDWRFNENIMSLLMVITLFDVENSNESFMDPEAIRKIKQDYCKLLRNYLATLYEESVVDQNYNRLLAQIVHTKQISEKHMRAHYDVLPDTRCNYRGYIMEVLDLNN